MSKQRSSHICGDPSSACDAECMDLAHRAELRTKEELAKHIARKIFEYPFGVGHNEVQRLQFRGRGENDLGGVCEDALVTAVRQALETFR